MTAPASRLSSEHTYGPQSCASYVLGLGVFLFSNILVSHSPNHTLTPVLPVLVIQPHAFEIMPISSLVRSDVKLYFNTNFKLCLMSYT